MITITAAEIEIIVGILTILGVLFTIFFYFQKPQIALERRVSTLEENDRDQDKQIMVIREEHSKNAENMLKEIKELTASINGLNVTVGKLETRIDERIPKGLPSLTPPGQ